MADLRRVRARIVLCQIVLSLLCIAVFSGWIRSQVQKLQFTPGFLPVWPGGESLAYDEFANQTGKKVVFLGNSVMLGADFLRMNKVARRHYGAMTLFNFGRPGTSVADYRAMLAGLEPLKPDLVVLQLHDVSVGEGTFNGVQLPRVFHTNLKGLSAHGNVRSQLGSKIFREVYGWEGFLESALYRLPFLAYRDAFRRREWEKSRGFFDKKFGDAQSVASRFFFQGVGPAFNTVHSVAYPDESAMASGYPGLRLDEFQCEQLTHLLNDLKRMEIPFLIYLQPVPPVFSKSDAATYLRRALAEGRIPFVDQRDRFGAGEFTDVVHLRDSRHLFELMFELETIEESKYVEIPWEQAGLRVSVERGLAYRPWEKLGAASAEGVLRKRDYLLFSNHRLVRVSPGTPLSIDKSAMADYAAGVPVVLDDLRKVYWAPPSTLHGVEIAYYSPGVPDARMASYFEPLRFVALNVPISRMNDVFEISVNGTRLDELGTMEATMNRGYWYSDGKRIVAMLTHGDPLRSIAVSYITKDNDLGRLLRNIGEVQQPPREPQ